MKKILVGAAAFGCIRGLAWAGKTEIPAEMSRAPKRSAFSVARRALTGLRVTVALLDTGNDPTLAPSNLHSRTQ